MIGDEPMIEELAPEAEPEERIALDWKRGRDGREYLTIPGRPGRWPRRGDEPIEDAIARATSPKDERPKRRSKAAPKPAPPKKLDLKELEEALTEAARSPAMPCAMFGDEWAANHFTVQAPVLARNLVVASEHNPWLRRKLEELSTGGELAMKVITLLGVGGALFGYAIPPIIWWFNLPVPDKAREMFGIPPARIDDARRAPAPVAAAA
jgi:hypothetical protein